MKSSEIRVGTDYALRRAHTGRTADRATVLEIGVERAIAGDRRRDLVRVRVHGRYAERDDLVPVAHLRATWADHVAEVEREQQASAVANTLAAQRRARLEAATAGLVRHGVHGFADTLRERVHLATEDVERLVAILDGCAGAAAITPAGAAALEGDPEAAEGDDRPAGGQQGAAPAIVDVTRRAVAALRDRGVAGPELDRASARLDRLYRIGREQVDRTEFAGLVDASPVLALMIAAAYGRSVGSLRVLVAEGLVTGAGILAGLRRHLALEGAGRA